MNGIHSISRATAIHSQQKKNPKRPQHFLFQSKIEREVAKT